MAHVHLKNPPIQEALVDLRAVVAEGTTFQSLDEAANKIAEEYPDRTERREGIFQLQMKGLEFMERMIQQGKPTGVIRTSADKSRVVQFRLDGFTFNRIRRYSTWEETRDEARRAWEIYKDSCKPAITRVALRYINVLEISGKLDGIAEYLTAPPPVPKELNGNPVDFLTKVTLLDEKLGARAIIGQAGIPTPNGMKLTIDIDVFRDGTFAKHEEAWDYLEHLREFKNRVFFASIGKRALELCQ